MLISVLSSRREERSKVSREIFNDLNFSESMSLTGVLVVLFRGLNLWIGTARDDTLY